MSGDPATARRSIQVRRRYTELISALQTDGDFDAARRCAELAVEQGVWQHPDQRPVHYVSGLTAAPMHSPSSLWFVPHLEQSYPRIRAELDAVTAALTDATRGGFLPVEEQLLGRGRWEQVTFYEAGHRFADACARFPVTASVVEQIPEVTHAGTGVVTLSWLYPGAHVVPHCGGTNGRLRVHLGLRVPDGPMLRVGDKWTAWEEGRCLVFDDSFEHEVRHDGAEARVVLLLDVPHPELDVRLLDRILTARTSFDERVVAYLTTAGLTRVELAGDGVLLSPDESTRSLVLRHLRETGASAVELRDGQLHYP